MEWFETAPDPPMNEVGPKRILVLDDQEALTGLCREYLSSLGHKVFEARHLEEARECLRRESIDLVLCDVGLKGGESGLDLMRELLPRAPDVAVCLMTASHDLQLAIDCLRQGAFDFITKPFGMAALGRAVERALGRRQTMINEREETDALMRSLARFPEDNPNPVFRVDGAGVLHYSNRAGQSLLREWRLELGEGLPETLQGLLRQTEDANDDGSRSAVEIGVGDRIFSFTATPIQGGSGYYFYGHDVTEWRAAERELVRLKNEATELSMRDQLTGMANRALLQKRFVELTARAPTTGERLAVVLLDLDHFKEINDVYGHEAGDKVLVRVALRLNEALRDDDVLCRWGGDEMVVLKSGLPDRESVEEFCRDLLNLGREAARSPALGAPITLSAGYAMFPADGEKLDSLLQKADQALYRAKEMGKDTWRGYDVAEDGAVFRGNPGVLARFNRTVNDEGIDVHYQPLIEATSGRMVAVEALARWTDPELGTVPPARFIPEAERRGLIGRLGECVLRKALDDLASWRESGLEIGLSVNLSRRQLLSRDFVSFVAAEVRRRALPPSLLTLEITECPSFFDTGAGRDRLEELAAAGYGISLDDFGTGYSSLAEIATMRFSELKIAMELSRQVVEEKGRRVVQAIVMMGRAMHLTVVAEGVETEEEATVLKSLGVDRLQGFLYARPMPADDLVSIFGQSMVNGEVRR